MSSDRYHCPGRAATARTTVGLLAALRDPRRGFSAVVVGEPHRAFYGNQFGLTVPLFARYGVELWVPEIGGPIDPENEAHELVMSVFGGMSKGERNRIKLRVRTAMAAQTLLEGRYLGGRPPDGYTLQDLGPHPNPAKAADGKHLRGLTPRPADRPDRPPDLPRVPHRQRPVRHRRSTHQQPRALPLRTRPGT
ncbi:hypothetical protein ACFYPG_06555 [Micromonospora sp. NPDC005553]|uniref:hypothetical protein n=1 Tax=Micromonospora sp. NPDC005553 TaxID=3364232 RepID=UPI003691A467